MNAKRPSLYFLTSMMVMLTLLLSACGGGAATATEAPAPEATSAPTEEPAAATSAPTEAPVAEVSGTLSVLEWAGYDAEDFWVDFKNANTDVTVNFEIGI